MMSVKTSLGGSTAMALLMIVGGMQRTIDAPLTEAATQMVASQRKMPVALVEEAAAQHQDQQVSTPQRNLLRK